MLRENGVLIIADFDKHEDEGMRKIYGDRWLGFSIEEISGMLTKNGMDIDKVHSFKIQNELNLNLFKSVMSHST